MRGATSDAEAKTRSPIPSNQKRMTIILFAAEGNRLSAIRPARAVAAALKLACQAKPTSAVLHRRLRFAVDTVRQWLEAVGLDVIHLPPRGSPALAAPFSRAIYGRRSCESINAVGSISRRQRPKNHAGCVAGLTCGAEACSRTTRSCAASAAAITAGSLPLISAMPIGHTRRSS
jgi:hypothetical protein